MNRLPKLVVALILSLLACTTWPSLQEVVSMKLNWKEGKWIQGRQVKVPGQYSILEFIREGDDIKNWKELLTIQNFVPPWGGPSPEDALNNLKIVMEKDCPGLAKWNVISKDQKSILYEWQARLCHDLLDRHEIGRILYGKQNIFVLRYTLKVYEMPSEKRDEWIQRFSTAKIVTNPSK